MNSHLQQQQHQQQHQQQQQHHQMHSAPIRFAATPEVTTTPIPMAHQHQPVELPLDLGLPTKRRADIYDDFSSAEMVSPKKMLKIEPNAQLFKVSEPSVLQASEPSIITTVVNSALTSVGSESMNNDNNPQAETQSETSTTREEGEEEPKRDLPFGYVHKLKKAWIKAYSSDPIPSGESSNPATPPSSQQQQSQSTSVRATPSPALSNKSTGSATSSSRGTGRGSGPASTAPTRIASSKPVNGHLTVAKKKLDSSSSESEEEDDDGSQNYRSSGNVRGAGAKKSTSGRGRGARHLRQRGSNVTKGRAIVSANASSGESLLGGDSDKDSDISTATSRKSQRDGNSANSASRKRGRKPGRSGSGKNSSVANSPSRTSSKKMKEETASLSSSSASSETPKRIVGTKKKKPSVAQLKKSGQSFLQDASCFEVAPKLAKCRECRWTQSQRNKKMPNIFCRFYAFRRVRYAKNGQLCVAGFCDPKRDVSQEDLGLWMASSDAAPDNLDDEQSIFLLENLKSDFEQMLKQERLAVEAHEGEGIYFIITAGICLMYIFSFLLFAAIVKSIRLILCSF
jgi:lysine-specific demethylase 3